MIFFKKIFFLLEETELNFCETTLLWSVVLFSIQNVHKNLFEDNLTHLTILSFNSEN